MAETLKGAEVATGFYGAGGRSGTLNLTGIASLDASASVELHEEQTTFVQVDTFADVWPVTTVTGAVHGFGMTNEALGMTLQTYFKVEEGSTLVIDHLARTMHVDGVLTFGYEGEFFPMRSDQYITTYAALVGPGFSAVMTVPNAETASTKTVSGTGAIDLTTNATVNPRARAGTAALEHTGSGESGSVLETVGATGEMELDAAGTFNRVREKTGAGVTERSAAGISRGTSHRFGTGVLVRSASGVSVFIDG